MRDPDTLLRLILPAYMAAYILVTYTLNVAGFIRRYGVDPRVTTRSDPVLYLCQVYRDVIFAALIGVVLVYAASPDLYRYFVPIPSLEWLPVRYSGVLLALAGLLIVRLAQHQLGAAWRIGIDRSSPSDELITGGLYGVSRNPIALGMMLSAFGLFLALPNVLTFAAVNLALLLFQVRIRLEEGHLDELHGEAYLEYRRTTGRWLGWRRTP